MHSVYVALELEGDFHITAMYCENSPLSVDLVRVIVETVTRGSKPETVPLIEPKLFDDNSLVFTTYSPLVEKVYQVLTACGLKHTYPELNQHITLGRVDWGGEELVDALNRLSIQSTRLMSIRWTVEEIDPDA